MTQNEQNELAKEIIQLIIDTLNITHVKAEDVNIESPLFGGDNELELDSVDAIEIVVALQKQYGIRIDSELPAREILTSIKSIVEYLEANNATKKLA
jgi:acyl carrier protein